MGRHLVPIVTLPMERALFGRRAPWAGAYTRPRSGSTQYYLWDTSGGQWISVTRTAQVELRSGRV